MDGNALGYSDRNGLLAQAIASGATILAGGMIFTIPDNPADSLASGLSSVVKSVKDTWDWWDNILSMSKYPPGVWPGDKGAKEWGRRNGVGSESGRRKFHDMKKNVKAKQLKILGLILKLEGFMILQEKK